MFHFNYFFKLKLLVIQEEKTSDKPKGKPLIIPLPYITTVQVGELKTIKRKDLMKTRCEHSFIYGGVDFFLHLYTHTI